MDETQHNTDDIRIDEIRQLLPPSLLLSELPILESSAQLINSTRSNIDNILNGDIDVVTVLSEAPPVADTTALPPLPVKCDNANLFSVFIVGPQYA